MPFRKEILDVCGGSTRGSETREKTLGTPGEDLGEPGLREQGENWRGAEKKTQKPHVNG